MKSIFKYILFLMPLMGMAILPAMAQNKVGDRDANLRFTSSKGWEFDVRAGINIGGATPLGLPREIRHISSFNPHLNGVIEGVVTKWFGEKAKWGAAVGVKIEEKRMTTGARVKNYHTEIIQDGDRVAGYFTGHVRTEYSSTDLTIPVTANYRIDQRWKVRAGMFFTYRMDGEFSGEVSDGYLRNGTPTGEKVNFDNGSSAQYDFSSDLRHFHWGPQVGVSWRAYRHFSINADLAYSFNNIFNSDFHTVTFAMHPVYCNVGFGYTF